MKLPTQKTNVGLSTIGLTGIILLIAVIWGQISPWWMILSVLFIISAIGNELEKN